MIRTIKMNNSSKFFSLVLVTLLIIMSFMPNFTEAALGDKANPTNTGLVSLNFGDPDYSAVPPESLMVFEETGTYTYDAVYTGINSATYYPDRLLLVIKPNSGILSISNVVETNVTTTQPSGTTGVYDVVIGDVTQPKFRFDATVGGTTQSITITFHKPKEDSTAGTGVYAFLPAPGQFTNEKMSTGGWGTIYNSGGATFKNMLNNTVSTGVSLGYFGGYVVFDMGVDGNGDGNVKNDANHPGGYDFKVIGNAFSGNSEPGGIQVSKDGITWYDIAGSFHYDDATKWNYSATYVDPVNGGSTGNTASDRKAVPYYIDSNTSNTASVAINTFHAHNWYPLAANYITGLDKSTGTNRLAFSEYKSGQNALNYTNTNTLTLSGVLLGGITSNSTATGAFGYADVTQGGDKIDLDWAVNRTTGQPVDLDYVRYVRVYNAVAKDLPPFGEISTEVTGIYNITDTSGSGVATTDLFVEDTSYNEVSTTNLSTATIHVLNGVSSTYTIYSDEPIVYVNSNKVDASSGYSITVNLTTGQTAYYRIITQNGTESPYVTLLKFVCP